MQTVIYFAAFAACPGNACPPPAPMPTQLSAVPVVIYQAAPRPLIPIFAPRPQAYVLTAPACVGAFCPKP